MRKVKLIGLILLAGLVIAGISYLIFNLVRPKGAGIYVESNPASTVYVNGEQAGRTPYRETVKSGEILLKLVPDSFEKPLAPYETKILLTAGVETLVRRDFGETEDASAGEIVSFEKVGNNETSISIISQPDSAQEAIDGQIKGFTPLKADIVAGEHVVVISKKGHAQRILSVKAIEGYKMTALVKLAPDGNSEEEKEPQPTPEPEKQKVEIKSTPTGFLRVRSEPSTLSDEVGQVDPGKQYELVDTDEDTGWFRIVYDDNKEGWISNQYAKLIEASNSSQTTSPTPTRS